MNANTNKNTNTAGALEGKHYIATDEDIARLAGDIIDGAQRLISERGIYFKALVATTQAELGAAPRERNGKANKLNETETAAHLKAFQAVFERFHAAVVQVAKKTLPDPDAALIRQRTGFSRSAGSTVRGYIRAGNDITTLAAHKVTKPMLATPRRKRKVSAQALQKRATTLGEALLKVMKDLRVVDVALARETLDPILEQLSERLHAPERAHGGRSTAHRNRATKQPQHLNG